MIRPTDRPSDRYPGTYWSTEPSEASAWLERLPGVSSKVPCPLWMIQPRRGEGRECWNVWLCPSGRPDTLCAIVPSIEAGIALIESGEIEKHQWVEKPEETA